MKDTVMPDQTVYRMVGYIKQNGSGDDDGVALHGDVIVSDDGVVFHLHSPGNDGRIAKVVATDNPRDTFENLMRVASALEV